MRASVIIAAAGSGKRLGSATPKAFIPIRGHALLWYSLRSIAAIPAIAEAVIAVPQGWERQARQQVEEAGLEIPVKLAAGGAERQSSVRIALALTSSESEFVAVHDAARPFATPLMFNECLEAASRSGAAIIAVPVADTLKRVEGRTILRTIARGRLWQAQTPQVFRRDLLIEVHERAKSLGIVATDDSDLVEQIGVRVAAVEGSVANLKVTQPEDLRAAEMLAGTIVHC